MLQKTNKLQRFRLYKQRSHITFMTDNQCNTKSKAMNTLQSSLRGYFLHQNYKFVANWNEKMSLVAAIFFERSHSLKEAIQKIEHYLRLSGTLP